MLAEVKRFVDDRVADAQQPAVFSAAVHRQLSGALVGAGRGADTEPPLLLRVMVNTMTVGQGAGVTAALSAQTGVRINAVDRALLKNELIRQGVKYP